MKKPTSGCNLQTMNEKIIEHKEANGIAMVNELTGVFDVLDVFDVFDGFNYALF
jgi:hypothetical protein